MNKRGDIRGQVTIFIIIAIVIIVAGILFFTLRKGIAPSQISKDLQPVYDNFLNCLEQDLRSGVDILGTQGGYIYLPEFEQGSTYTPLSSQLDFMGNAIPYWSYVSGNNIEKGQVPTLTKMEEDLEGFVSEKIIDCDFQSYYEQGIEIDLDVENLNADARINEGDIEIILNGDLAIDNGETSAVVSSHKVQINSKLGKFYDIAHDIYNQEQEEMFLENYAIDTLRLNAPVDGVELSCAPETWVARDVVQDLQNAIEDNTLALKIKGNYYSLSGKDDKYFVVTGLPELDESVQFLNSKNWPYKIEITPAEGELLIAEPIGNQPGLGVLGFCYVNYHFVYDVVYPVLIQIYNNDEIFQFPVAVVVKGNKVREALDSSAVNLDVPALDLCNYKNTSVRVSVYDTNLQPLDADISFDCLGVRCSIGRSEGGFLNGNFPVCVNGFIRASSEGYVDSKYLYSTTKEGSVDIALDKKYDLDIVLKKDSRIVEENAIVSFTSEENKITISYPELKSVQLSEGQYEISVYSFSNTSITISEEIKEQCVSVHGALGIGGIFRNKEKKCFDIKIPGQIITNALSGGGKQQYFITESELKNSRVVELDFDGFSIPRKIEDLQNNYQALELQGVDVNFK